MPKLRAKLTWLHRLLAVVGVALFVITSVTLLFDYAHSFGPEPKLKQDLRWGVLAVNTNRAVYRPGEQAKLTMAVLRPDGRMACQAKVTLEIKNPWGRTTTLSTANQGIKVNPECEIHNLVDKPDFEADFIVGTPGYYTVTLTAETAKGKRSISDRFWVSRTTPFEIEREMPTRLYPAGPYQAKIVVNPRQSFRGIIEESLPASFTVRRVDQQGELIQRRDGEGNLKEQHIAWQVDWERGKRYELSYEFQPPPKSPDFHLLSALVFKQAAKADPIYEEAKSWQLAIDAVPSGIIVAWPGTAGTIPAGWTRVTGLDTYFLEGTASDPSVSAGGAASHTHTSPTHTHSVPDHTHTDTTSAVSGGTTAASGSGSGLIQNSHDHAYTTGSMTGISANNSQSANLGTASNNPPYTEVIWIQSNGTTEIPNGAWAFFRSDTLPTNWTRQAGNTFLKGAAGGGNGGGTGGTSDSHGHTDTGHTHTQNAHDHGTGTGQTEQASGSQGASKGGGTTYSISTHRHSITDIGTQTATEGPDSTANVANADAQPPFMKLNIIQNGTGSSQTPSYVIAAWLGTVADIPPGWVLCNGSNGTCPNLNDKFIKGAAANGESGVTTGGALSHSHGTGNTHTHAVNSHSHTVTVGTDNTTGLLNNKTGATVITTGHSHTLGVSGGSGTTGTATITADTSTTETRPPFKEAVFIQKLPPPVISGYAYNGGTTNALTECDGTTANISLRAGGTTYTTACDNDTGYWEKELNFSIDSGTIVVWINGGSTRGAVAIKYDGSGDSANNLLWDGRLVAQNERQEGKLK